MLSELLAGIHSCISCLVGTRTECLSSISDDRIRTDESRFSIHHKNNIKTVRSSKQIQHSLLVNQIRKIWHPGKLLWVLDLTTSEDQMLGQALILRSKV
jgi:hypothetical protein